MHSKLFSLILAIGFLGSILEKDLSFSNYENRYLTSLPSLSVSNFFDGTYAAQMDTYLTDHFIGRNLWIRAKTNTEHYLLQKQVIKDVYLAKNHYLMNRYTNSDITPSLLQQNITYVNKFQKRYQATLLLIPPASEVLTDYLPTPIAQIESAKLLSSVVNAYPCQAILVSHKSEPIYYRTDHHWTLLGAYYLYQQLVESPIPYTPRTVSTSFQGTIAKKLGGFQIFDSLQQIESDSSFRVTYDTTVTCNSLYSTAFLNTSDQYSYYLDGNHALTQIKNLSPDKNSRGKSVLIVKDSFANTFATLICHNYETTSLIDLRYYNGSISSFLLEHPSTDVIFLYSSIHFMQDSNLSKLLK